MLYFDRKRYLWPLSVLYPLQPFIGIALHALTGRELWLLTPILLNYGLGTFLDAFLGEDRSNPPDEFVMELDRDRYYRLLTWAVVPLHFVTLLGTAAYAGTQELGPVGFFGLAAVTGMTAGLAINTGHELGHKNSRFEKWLARIVLAVPAYGHFTIAHNLGHHRNVSTPADPASARMGESIYRFAYREIVGAFSEAWNTEKVRLHRREKSAWHADNQILQSYALSLAIAAALVILFGLNMIPFLVVHHALAYWQLTSANYIEHYGLLRENDENGEYRPCEPQHSWNSNHVFSNLVLFHLARHSDHHAHPLRRYQSLRHYEELPALPFGYFGAYLLAYVPPLWFRIMNPRLMALPGVAGDLDRVNVDSAARAGLAAIWGEGQRRDV